jgi:molybdopterin-guanine dinucleotide biosynthesis protein A
MTWTLAILCGGQSRRLGTDKGLYRPRGEGEPLVVRMLRALGADASDRIVVVRDAAQRELYQDKLRDLSLRIRIVTDEDLDPTAPRAAIVGVRTALAAAWGDPVFILPVDQVGAKRAHVDALLACLDRDDRYGDFLTTKGQRSAAFYDALDRPLPFPSVWERGLEPALVGAIASEALSVKGALAAVNALPAAHPAEIPMDSLLVASNTQAELDALDAAGSLP